MGCFGSTNSKKNNPEEQPLPAQERSEAPSQQPPQQGRRSEAPLQQPPSRLSAPADTPSKPSVAKPEEKKIKLDSGYVPEILWEPVAFDQNKSITLRVKSLLETLNTTLACTPSISCTNLYAQARTEAKKTSPKSFLLGYKGRILSECEKPIGEFGVVQDASLDCYFEP